MEEQNTVTKTTVTSSSPIPPTPPVIDPTEKKKSLPVAMSLLIILLILSLGALVYFVFQNMQLQKQITAFKVGYQVASNLASPTPVATADPTSSWGTYNGVSNDYSFKHPIDLKSDTTSAGAGFESIRFMFVGPVQIASGRTQTELFDGYFFSVTKVGPLAQFDPNTEVTKQQQNSKETCPQVSDVTEVTVSGSTAFKYTCPNNYDLIYVTNGKNTYYITQFYTGDNLNSYKAITDQILSTFKFTQ